MSALRPPGLGPIVGHTTDKTARLWIRAADPEDEDIHLNQNRRTVGVIALVGEEGKKIEDIKICYFRLHRKYDRTGTFTLGKDLCLTESNEEKAINSLKPDTPLQPDTPYEARLGSLTIDDPYSFDVDLGDSELIEKLPDPKVWIDDLLKLDRSKSSAFFRTFPESGETKKNFVFLLGSCRYPGFLSQRKSDRIFKRMLEQVKKDAAFTLMVGDQIYADLASRHIPIGRADTAREFQARYLTAFGTPHMRQLLRNTPTYMILDDHEIEDNWHQGRMRSTEKSELFNLAMSAYRSYQWVHGPKTFGDRLYYKFQYDNYPFFVLDTRTHRYMDDDLDSLADNHLLGRPRLSTDDDPTQLDRLIDWLKKQNKNVPKFIVSSSVFVPSSLSARWGRDGEREKKIYWKEKSDSWPAFPVTKAKILKTIIENKIQNVIFLSGDIHSSCVSKITFSGFEGAEKLKAFSVVSSAFYWPFWCFDGEPSSFVHDSKKKGQEDTFPLNGPHDTPGLIATQPGPMIDYESFNFTQENNFCRVEISCNPPQLIVKPIDEAGQIICRRDYDNSKKNNAELIARLELAKW